MTENEQNLLFTNLLLTNGQRTLSRKNDNHEAWNVQDKGGIRMGEKYLRQARKQKPRGEIQGSRGTLRPYCSQELCLMFKPLPHLHVTHTRGREGSTLPLSAWQTVLGFSAEQPLSRGQRPLFSNQTSSRCESGLTFTSQVMDRPFARSILRLAGKSSRPVAGP